MYVDAKRIKKHPPTNLTWLLEETVAWIASKRSKESENIYKMIRDSGFSNFYIFYDWPRWLGWNSPRK